MKKKLEDTLSDAKKVFYNSTASSEALKSANEKLTTVFQRIAPELYSHREASHGTSGRENQQKEKKIREKRMIKLEMLMTKNKEFFWAKYG